VAESPSGAFLTRVVSALVLIPPVLAAVHFGTPAFEILLALVSVLLAYEWVRLSGRGTGRAWTGILIAAVLAVFAAAVFRYYGTALLATLAGALALYAVARLGRFPAPLWLGAGVLYVGLPVLALIWLRMEPASGREILFWLLGLVWATDTGALFFGKAIGGPKLAPGISPNKTWAGLIGGIVCASLWGLAMDYAMELLAPVLLFVLSGALALVSQAGDLAESRIKRHFGVKDSGGLIPGHGGMFDRLDGLLAVAPVVAILYLVGGEILLPWR
jgi:phosphatidate cytidylyltransferase